MKFEKDCKHPFFIACKSKINGFKSCEIDLEDGTTLTYMPIPNDVRFCFGSITRYYKTEEGQRLISERLEQID
jgi:hypothetical protein